MEYGEMLYFQVMMQAHNRHNSMSFYLAAIATIDTAALTVGESVPFNFTSLLSQNYHETLFSTTPCIILGSQATLRHFETLTYSLFVYISTSESPCNVR